MRKLIFAINLTIDGCCDHTKGVSDETQHQFWADLLRNSDTFLYGRKTFELMVPFWPDVAKSNSGPTKAINDFAQAFVSVKEIVVVSRTLKNVEDEKVRIINGDLENEIRKLKDQPGGDIIAGGVDVPSQLINLGLVDECIFVIQPVLVGEGRRLLENFSLQEKLKLVSSRALESGSVVIHYTRN